MVQFFSILMSILEFYKNVFCNSNILNRLNDSLTFDKKEKKDDEVLEISDGDIHEKLNFLISIYFCGCKAMKENENEIISCLELISKYIKQSPQPDSILYDLNNIMNNTYKSHENNQDINSIYFFFDFMNDFLDQGLSPNVILTVLNLFDVIFCCSYGTYSQSNFEIFYKHLTQIIDNPDILVYEYHGWHKEKFTTEQSNKARILACRLLYLYIEKFISLPDEEKSLNNYPPLQDIIQSCYHGMDMVSFRSNAMKSILILLLLLLINFKEIHLDTDILEILKYLVFKCCDIIKQEKHPNIKLILEILSILVMREEYSYLFKKDIFQNIISYFLEEEEYRRYQNEIIKLIISVIESGNWILINEIFQLIDQFLINAMAKNPDIQSRISFCILVDHIFCLFDQNFNDMSVFQKLYKSSLDSLMYFLLYGEFEIQENASFVLMKNHKIIPISFTCNAIENTNFIDILANLIDIDINIFDKVLQMLHLIMNSVEVTSILYEKLTDDNFINCLNLADEKYQNEHLHEQNELLLTLIKSLHNNPML